MPLPSDPSIEYIQRFLRDTIDSSWPAFKAHLAGTLAALPDEKERTEDEARRAVLCDQLKQMKPAYEKEKRTFESQLSTLIATNNANVQQLATTHMLTEQVIGKRPVSPSASFPALKAIRPASPQQDLSTRPRTGSLPASPGTEALVQRISDLQREKAGVYHELGTIFWSIVPTDDEDLMGRLDPSVYAKIVKTLGDVTQEASDCSDYAKFLLHEVDWAGRSVTSICEAKWEGGVAQVWSELGGPAETQKAAVKDEDVRRDMGERTFDFHAAHDFANLPFRISGGQLLYGENMSAADQSEKHERTGDTNRKGKLVDFLYMVSGAGNSKSFGQKPGICCRRESLSTDAYLSDEKASERRFFILTWRTRSVET
ncbi:hypothetical protein BDZ88DRAFT_266756 [Geranomyces variabilis]|nr:hypothetical protein BDZ88DRAFT_266756 [Geranomyces variabilis]